MAKKEERQMSLVQVRLIEEAFKATHKTEVVTTPWAWADIENVLSDEWEIGPPGHNNRRDP